MKRLSLILFFLVWFVQDLNAQCAMCKAVAEDKAEEVGGSNVNTAVVYIMIIPYIIIISVAFFAFRKKSYQFN